ncbi:Scramblase-domain-containing protein [Trametes versicolor FP-101664 SS1]|uniref:Scramblase-domain-containing protein n=1 Tax=Trametes versicolor (strain FP-101664) TaxID=717944 RepID=UPI0004623510|nr:Scramblase-domain-containing protein [Trametes versicolor FP-101664 SS1]EIW60031.1 Scramblase-domain-containing protein [Trametes versicolor FP-101664 SS1]
MLSLRASTRTISQLTRLSSRAPSVPLQCTRAYALSRFERPRPGVGRQRPKLDSQQARRRDDPLSDAASQPPPGTDPFAREDQPSAAQSPLWEESVRAPASNPEESLHKLLMENSRLIITREIEMLNIFMGFEQANRYVITNEAGETLGYIAEEPRGFLSMFSRQVFRTHRPFRAIVMDSQGSPILWLRRPFAFINSRMYVQRLKDFDAYTPEGEPVLDTFAEVQQRWHPWRRRYDLFLRETPHRILSTLNEPQPEPEPDLFNQFARIDGGFLAWHFSLMAARGEAIASVNRAFRGFGRELFTDTGQYFVNFDGAAASEEDGSVGKQYLIRNLSVEERALVLATAVNIDFDYFSRHSGGGMGG